MRILSCMLLGFTAAENLRRTGTPDTEYYGRPDGGGLGWCPMRQESFEYMKGGSICAPKCSSNSDCPAPSGGAKGPAECAYHHCFLHCNQDSDCPQLPGGQSFCAKGARPFNSCYFK